MKWSEEITRQRLGNFEDTSNRENVKWARYIRVLSLICIYSGYFCFNLPKIQICRRELGKFRFFFPKCTNFFFSFLGNLKIYKHLNWIHIKLVFYFFTIQLITQGIVLFCYNLTNTVNFPWLIFLHRISTWT